MVNPEVTLCLPWSNQHPHFKDIVSLDSRLMAQSWDDKQWEGGENFSVFALRDIKTIGFSIYQIAPGDEVAHLLKIAIEPSYRGSSVTQEFWEVMLMTLRAKGVKKIYLEVEVTNKRAVGFYKRVGFKLLHTAKAFYQNGEDAHKMELAI
ncbi:MAG: GNAT family N-acetyltransferase [Bacteriovoracaceae bacterium]|nr:GNAT family N-acetyltransferase [Bacteriovoracaceae bacterium]